MIAASCIRFGRWLCNGRLEMDLDQVLSDLRELSEPVPKPLRLPTPDEVDAAEARLEISFHSDYRRYLLEASDVVLGSLEPCTVAPGGGHTDLIEIAEAAWVDWGVPRDLLPICYDNGDHYCMNSEGEIVFWPHDGTSDESWPDLATWIQRVWIEHG